MNIKNINLIRLFVFLTVLIAANGVAAQDEAVEAAEKIMVWQLEALKDKDLQRFIKHGNKTFKEFTEAFPDNTFETLRRDKIARGYRLQYLGAIRRMGGHTHVWKIKINGDKYELLGKLSLTKYGQIYGFEID